MLAVAQNTLILALVLTMLAGIILGMGMPTTPAYIVQVALLVPAIVRLAMPLEAAHMFAFYFAILSAITPPVALAVYAANSLSGGRLWETGIAAVKLGATGYIIPFMFVFGPSLLMIGSWDRILLATRHRGDRGDRARRLAARLFLAADPPVGAASSCSARRSLLIKPGWITDLIGLGALAAVLISQQAFESGRCGATADAARRVSGATPRNPICQSARRRSTIAFSAD